MEISSIIKELRASLNNITIIKKRINEVGISTYTIDTDNYYAQIVITKKNEEVK